MFYKWVLLLRKIFAIVVSETPSGWMYTITGARTEKKAQVPLCDYMTIGSVGRELEIYVNASKQQYQS